MMLVDFDYLYLILLVFLGCYYNAAVWKQRPFRKRVYGQFSIETIRERQKQNREFSGLFFSVLLI